MEANAASFLSSAQQNEDKAAQNRKKQSCSGNIHLQPRPITSAGSKTIASLQKQHSGSNENRQCTQSCLQSKWSSTFPQ